MGKTVCISLPNGRSWDRKGEAVAHFKSMLHRYADGERVSNTGDHNDLAALLTIYDSVLKQGEASKSGSGVSHFERRKDLDHPGHTSCFFVVRVDGTSIDFSTRRALDAAGTRLLSQTRAVSS